MTNKDTLIRALAATVSVAHRTLLSSIIYLSGSFWKKRESMPQQHRVIKINPIMVPMTPRKMIIPKFWKKRDLRSE